MTPVSFPQLEGWLREVGEEVISNIQCFQTNTGSTNQTKAFAYLVDYPVDYNSGFIVRPVVLSHDKKASLECFYVDTSVSHQAWCHLRERMCPSSSSKRTPTAHQSNHWKVMVFDISSCCVDVLYCQNQMIFRAIVSLTEISSRPDAEGDKRLDKLESFLDRLHNKGYSYDLIQNCVDCTLLYKFILTAVDMIYVRNMFLMKVWRAPRTPLLRSLRRKRRR